MTPLTLDEKRQRIAEADAVEQYRRDVALDERHADAQHRALSEQETYNVKGNVAQQTLLAYLERKEAHDAALVEWAKRGEALMEERYELKAEAERVRSRFVEWATWGLHTGLLSNVLGDPAAAAEDLIRERTRQPNAYLLWVPSYPTGWAGECLGFLVNFVAQYSLRR